jgi:hypothetical protein
VGVSDSSGDATASELYQTLMSDMGQTFAKVLDAIEAGADWRVDYEHAQHVVQNHRQAWLSFQTRHVTLSAEVQQKIDALDAAVFLLEKRGFPDEARVRECLFALMGPR